MKTLALNISLEDLFDSLRRLSNKDKKAIYSFLEAEILKEKVKERDQVYLISEKSLEKDWPTEEENQAWKNL
jgi:hypothetical protein